MVVRTAAVALGVILACAPGPVKRPEGPSLWVERDTWEFGTVKYGDTAETDIALRNVGTETLVVDLFSTCDCLRAEASPAVISPGGKSVLRLSYTGDEVKTRVTKTLFIDSNARANPRLCITVTGAVIPGDVPRLMAIPDPLGFDKSAGAGEEAWLTISNRGSRELAITEIRCFGCVAEWNAKTLSQGEEADLRVELLPGWLDKRWIEIESNDPVRSVRKIALVELQ